MMEKFLYVFNEDDKEKLLKQGFTILKDDMIPYVFKNDATLLFDGVRFVAKDEMLF